MKNLLVSISLIIFITTAFSISSFSAEWSCNDLKTSLNRFYSSYVEHKKQQIYFFPPAMEAIRRDAGNLAKTILPERDQDGKLWFEDEAKQNNIAAQTYLGLIILFDNPKEAYALFCSAAEQCYSPAQSLRGFLLTRGLGVKQDYRQSIKYYQMAIDQGYSLAQNNLGYMFSKGIGVEKDRVQAVAYYKMAAEQNYPAAQRNLAFKLHENKDINQALYWYFRYALTDFCQGKKLLSDFIANIPAVKTAILEILAFSDYTLTADQIKMMIIAVGHEKVWDDLLSEASDLKPLLSNSYKQIVNNIDFKISSLITSFDKNINNIIITYLSTPDLLAYLDEQNNDELLSLKNTITAYKKIYTDSKIPVFTFFLAYPQLF